MEGARQPVFLQGNSQDRLQDCCCCIYITRLHSYGAMNTPIMMIVTLTQHIIFPFFCRTGSRTQLNSRLADARALRAASAVEYCDYLQSPGMMPCFPDDFSQMQTHCRRSHGQVGSTFQTVTTQQFKFNHAWKDLQMLRRAATR